MRSRIRRQSLTEVGQYRSQGRIMQVISSFTRIAAQIVQLFVMSAAIIQHSLASGVQIMRLQIFSPKT